MGKKFVVACVLEGPANGEAQASWTRKYGTNNRNLEELRKWLASCGCTHVVMESTAEYWRPVFNVLEEMKGLQIVAANSQQVKGLRGHKTDRDDARWLAHLPRHGMIRQSYIPPRQIRELRHLTRRQRQLVRTGAQERNRVQKILEGANIKIGNVLSDVFGLSGQLILEAVIEGKATAEEMAQFAQRSARKKIPQIQAALEGHRITDMQRTMIRMSLDHMAFVEAQIELIDTEIAAPRGAVRTADCAQPAADDTRNQAGRRIESAGRTRSRI